MKKYIITILTCFVLSSCFVQQNINIRSDGSALINTQLGSDTSIITKYYRSNIIYNIDTNIYFRSSVQFEISNIDSIGQYLPNPSPGFFRFRIDSNKLIITDGHTKAFKDDYPFCCTVDMQIKFDNDIIVKSANRSARKDGKKSVLIKRTRRQLIKGKKKTDVVISFK